MSWSEPEKEVFILNPLVSLCWSSVSLAYGLKHYSSLSLFFFKLASKGSERVLSLHEGSVLQLKLYNFLQAVLSYNSFFPTLAMREEIFYLC